MQLAEGGHPPTLRIELSTELILRDSIASVEIASADTASADEIRAPRSRLPGSA
jgi:hypothetical protein